MTRSELLIDGSTDSPRVYVFAHGAGAPMDTDWMTAVASRLAKREIKVVRFEFPYMATRDSMGTQAEVACYALSQQIQLSWLEDGDHSFKPRVKSGDTLAGHLQQVVQQIDVFMSALAGDL